MSLLTDVEDEFRTFADDLRTRAERIAGHFVPVVHDSAAALDKLTSSPIVQELLQLVAPLDKPVEDAVVAIIHGAGLAAEKIAELTRPADAPPENPQP